MNEADALHVVVRLLLGPDSLPVQVHDGRYVDESEVGELLAALTALVDVYRGESTVPKVLALALVDITARFDNRFYSADQQERLEDLGQEIERLAEELFSE